MTIDLDELERLARAATPGPWRQGDSERLWVSGAESQGHIVETTGVRDFEDASFIAASNPAAILELVARVRELESDLHAAAVKAGEAIEMWPEIERLRGALSEACDIATWALTVEHDLVPDSEIERKQGRIAVLMPEHPAG